MFRKKYIIKAKELVKVWLILITGLDSQAVRMTESDSAQGYYPLEIGNLWEYWDSTWNEYLFTLQAITDTIMPNGISYTYLESDGPYYTLFYRQSGSKVYNYFIYEENEFILYDFSKTTGDTVGMNFYEGDTTVITVVYDQMVNIFGEIRRQWGFWEQSITTSEYILTQVTDGIGVTRSSWEAAPYDEYLRGAMINGTTYGTLTTDRTFDVAYPDEYQLLQNFPNPFNSTTMIRFQISDNEYIMVTVFDIMGREVRGLYDGKSHIGLHQIVWDGRDNSGIEVGSGSYVYAVKTENLVISRKMILLR